MVYLSTSIAHRSFYAADSIVRVAIVVWIISHLIRGAEALHVDTYRTTCSIGLESTVLRADIMH